MRYVDSKGNPLKPNQQIKIYRGRKLLGQGMIKKWKGKRVVYRVNKDGKLSEHFCLLKEVLEKATKVLLIPNKK